MESMFPDVTSILLRIVGVILMLIMIITGIRVTISLLKFRSPSQFIVKPFEVVSGGKIAPEQGYIVGRILTARIHQIHSILTADLTSYRDILTRIDTGQTGGLAPSWMIDPITEQAWVLEAQASTDLNLSFGKPFNIDVVGILNYFSDQMETGNAIIGTISIDKDFAEVYASVDINKSQQIVGPWSFKSKPSLSDAVDELAFRFVRDHQQHPLLHHLEINQFKIFVESLEDYQKYLHSISQSNNGKGARISFAAAEKGFAELVADEVPSSLPYSYLASIRRSQHRYNDAIDLLENAKRIDPENTYAISTLPELSKYRLIGNADTVAISVSEQVISSKDYPELKMINLSEAQELAASKQQVKIGILANESIVFKLPGKSKSISSIGEFGTTKYLEQDMFYKNALDILISVNPNIEIVSVGMENLSQSIPDVAAAGIKILFIPLGYYMKPAEELSPEQKDLQQAIENAVRMGITVVVSAGNARKSATRVVTFPALMDEVISVGAIDQNDQLTDNSSFGDWVTLYGPSLLLSFEELKGVPVFKQGETFAAAAVVTGIVSLMLSVKPDLDPKTVKEILSRTAVDISDKNSGLLAVNNRVDADAAVAASLPN